MESLNLNPDPLLDIAPGRNAFDHALTAAKLGTLALPFLGAGVTFFDLLTGPMRNKRFSAWCEELRLRLNDLSQKVDGLTFERLMEDEAFFSAFAQATQTAIKSHQQEKLEALRNAVLNVAIGGELDPNRQYQFLALVDRFSEAHLLILRFLNDPARYFQMRGQVAPQLNHVQGKMLVNSLVTQAFPTLGKSPSDPSATSFQFVELVLTDLMSCHLVAFERNQETWSVPAFAIRPGGGPIGKMTKHLGEEFLRFISEPDPASSCAVNP